MEYLENLIDDSFEIFKDLLILGIYVGIVLLARIIILKVFYKIFKFKEEFKGIFKSIINGITFLVLLILIPYYFGEISWLFKNFVEIGDSGISLFLILIAIFIILFAHRLSIIIKNFILKNLYEKYKVEKSTRFTLNTFFHYIIMFIAVMISLTTLGINLNTLTVFVSIIGIGIGFGMQNIASNFISGLIILFEQPIKVGDRVLIEDIIGDVVDIKMRATVVKTLNNEHIIIPNSFFLEEKVMNRSFGDEKLRVRVPFGVSYNSDVFEVKKIALDVAKKLQENHIEVLKDPEPAVGFTNYGDSSLDFVLLFWIETPQNDLRLQSEARFLLFKAFKDNNIEIPFPQRDLHLRSVDKKLLYNLNKKNKLGEIENE